MSSAVPPSSIEHPTSTLRAIVLLVAIAASVQAPLVYLNSVNPLEVLAPLLIAGSSWLVLFLLHRGYKQFVAPLMVGAVLLAAAVGAVAFGSVRTASGVLLIAATAGAGIFLTQRALIVTVIIGMVGMGVLTWMESQGMLRTPDFRVGVTTWVTHAMTMVVVAIMVFYSRTKTQQALQRQHEEIQRRIRSEQERDRNLERFTRIFRKNPSPMVAQSARTGLIMDVNPAFERSYGYTRESVLGQHDAFLWAEPAQRKAYLEKLLAHRSAHQFACMALRADGTRFHALISSEMGDDDTDRLVISTITDVSIQTQSLEQLRRSEERFAKAFNFSPMNLSITRLSDGMILEVNRSGDISPGLDKALLRGKTTLETGAWPSPSARQAFISRLRREGRINGFETRMRGKDGKPMDVRLWAVIIDIDGEECVLSSTVNITEEKRREALLLSVAEGMTGETGETFFYALTRHAALALRADVVVVSEIVSDQEVQTLSVWKDGEPYRNFRYDPGGTPCQATIGSNELSVHESGLATEFPAESPITGVTAEAYVGKSLRDPDGTTIGVLKALWRQPITLTAEMQALMSIFSSRAASELIRLRRDREIQTLNATLEQRVLSRTAELEKLNAELDSFAYSVSHDLKSPLRAIDGFTRLLGEQLHDRLTQDEEQLFQRVLASTRRMSTLIADLLALARVSQGELQRVDTALSEIAEQVMQAEQMKQPQRVLHWRIEPGIWCVCDPRLIRIVLENLLGNAVKYTRDQAQPLIELSREKGTAHQGDVFVIRDNGVGFDMAYADKLFKPFQRLHRPSEFEGTGIGLATVHRIVKRHGGHIRGASRPGLGAEFRFSLSTSAVPS